MAKPQTIASAKWNKKAGYRTKGFSLKGELIDAFADACKSAGRSQASVIAEAMEGFIKAMETGEGCVERMQGDTPVI